jgi:hypothetical protein
MDEEGIITKYALLLGYFGENDKQVQDYAAQYAADQALWVKMVALNMEYRLLVDNYPK